MALASRIEAVRATLRQQIKPRRFVPEVEQVWLVEQRQMRKRQRFLVLEGPSCTGKTVYATTLAEVGRTLELNCASTVEPDLRAFRPDLHTCVVFDEASCEMVLRCKKLFQAPDQWVSMSHSQTNCHSYQVWMHGCMLIVCSNRWSQELTRLSECDRSWLVQNSVHVQVDSPLWVDTDSALSRSPEL